MIKPLKSHRSWQKETLEFFFLIIIIIIIIIIFKKKYYKNKHVFSISFFIIFC